MEILLMSEKSKWLYINNLLLRGKSLVMFIYGKVVKRKKCLQTPGIFQKV